MSPATLTNRMIWLAASVAAGLALGSASLLWQKEVSGGRLSMQFYGARQYVGGPIAVGATLLCLVAVVFFTVLFSGRVFASRDIGWVVKLVLLLLIVAGACALAAGILFAGCLAVVTAAHE